MIVLILFISIWVGLFFTFFYGLRMKETGEIATAILAPLAVACVSSGIVGLAGDAMLDRVWEPGEPIVIESPVSVNASGTNTKTVVYDEGKTLQVYSGQVDIITDVEPGNAGYVIYYKEVTAKPNWFSAFGSNFRWNPSHKAEIHVPVGISLR